MKLTTTHPDSGYDKSLVCMDVSIEIGDGEKVCILGRNGVGKTTLLKTLMGLLPISQGEGAFDGRSIRNLPPSTGSRVWAWATCRRAGESSGSSQWGTTWAWAPSRRKNESQRWATRSSSTSRY